VSIFNFVRYIRGPLLALTLVSASLSAHAQFDPKAKSLTVDSDREGFILLDLPKTKMQLSPFVVFVRPNGSDFEIIARGKIETIQEDKILVSLDRTSILKFPLKGDLAVPLGTPKDWPKDSDERVIDPPLRDEEAEVKPDPGYLEFQYGFLQGSITTTPSDGKTNDYKDVKSYSPSFFALTYFTDMFWHMGLSIEHWSGDVPTRTYTRDSGVSNESVTNLTLNYRFSRLWWKYRVRPTLRLTATSSSFTTNNTDEALLSSSMSGYGIGGRIAYERDLLFVPRGKNFDYDLSHAYFNLDLLPFVSVEDSGVVKRGILGSALIADYKLGVSGVVYMGFLPFAKRWTLEAGYGGRFSSLKFQGKTSKNPSDFYVIPEGTTSTENFGYFYVTLGLRFSDALGQMLKPR
jgi:hypothetical protein